MQLIEIPLSPSFSSTLFPFYTKSCWNLEKNKKLYRPCKSFTRSFVLDHFYHSSIHPSIYFFLFDAFHSSPKRTTRRWNILAGGGGEGEKGGGGETKSRDFLGRPEGKKRSATYRLIDPWCLPRMLALPFKERSSLPPGRREEESWWNQDENVKKIESKHESIIDRSNLIPLSRPSCPYPPNRFRDRLFFIAFAARRLICCSSADHVSGKSTVAASKSLVIFFDEAFEHPPTLAESHLWNRFGQRYI